jgi:hypothetical protein
LKNTTNKTGLSPSSLALFQSCERRYYHYKIAATPHDSDYVDDVSSLQIGSAFHKVLEDRLHDLKGLKYGEVAEVVAEHNLNYSEHTPLVYAMLLRYREMHTASKRKVVAVEMEIAEDGFLGYVDAIMTDQKGGWWICDMKTAASWNPSILPTLYLHPQLSLYANFSAHIATSLNLNVKKFGGCRYLLTTKSKLKQRESESAQDFTKRLYGSVASLDIGIPISKMNPSAVADIHNEVSRKILINGKSESNYCRNYNSCFTYYRPCPWFSKCHGFKYTEGLGES